MDQQSTDSKQTPNQEGILLDQYQSNPSVSPTSSLSPTIPTVPPKETSGQNKLLRPKNIMALLLLLLMALAIPFAVERIGQTQTLKSRASGEHIKFSGNGVNCDSSTPQNCTTTTDTVKVEINSGQGMGPRSRISPTARPGQRSASSTDSATTRSASSSAGSGI